VLNPAGIWKTSTKRCGYCDIYFNHKQ